MLTRTEIHMVIRAVRPVAHAHHNDGNRSILMTAPTETGAGVVDVPIISGASLRHALRESASYATLEAAGRLEERTLPTECALRALVNGGVVVKGSAGSALKLDRWREQVGAFRPLGIFGGCIDDAPRAGRLDVEHAWLMAEETRETLHPWLDDGWAVEQAGPLRPWRTAIYDAQAVRGDPLRDTRAVVLLEDGAKPARRGTAEEDKSTQMPRTFQAVRAGARFFWCFGLVCGDPLDLSVLANALHWMIHWMRAGGQRGTGHGRIAIEAVSRVDWVPQPTGGPVLVRTPADGILGAEAREPYLAYVRERPAEFQAFLEAVKA